MKKIDQHSIEFRRVMKNLELEDLYMKPGMKKKVIEVINNESRVTPSLLKEIMAYGKV